MLSVGDSPSSFPSITTSPSAVPSRMSSIESTNNDKPSLAQKISPSLGESPRKIPRVTPIEIKALPGRKVTGDELTTYGDVIEQEKTGMIRISGFNTNSIKLDEIRSICQEDVNQQINIQCFQEVCRDTRKSTILQ